jgi:hypothetical protein
MTNRGANHGDQTGKNLAAVMPEVAQLGKQQREILSGLVRRTLLLERKAESSALNVFRMEDIEGLKALIKSLPFTPKEEIPGRVAELKLSPEEAELEAAYWVFHHQTAEGDLLVKERLMHFKLVRIMDFGYLLIGQKACPEIVHGFNAAFGNPYDIFSGSALHIDGDKWSGWAWFLDPDPADARRAKAQWEEIWKEMSR